MSAVTSATTTVGHSDDLDMDIVALWLKRDPSRWIAGFVAGLLAGVLTLAVGTIVALAAGREFWMPEKMAAGILLGHHALEYGFNVVSIGVGFVFVEAVAALHGVIFAHFTAVNSRKVLLPMGLVWGLWTWIFMWNLFMQSFASIRWLGVSSGAMMPVCLAFGFGMSIVGLIHPTIDPTTHRTIGRD